MPLEGGVSTTYGRHARRDGREMTKKQSEREQAIAILRETLRPGDKLYTVLRGVSRTGMSRTIDVYRITCENGETVKSWLSPRVARACNLTFNAKAEAIRMDGCGMDMGFEIVYTLGRVLWPQGFAEKCTACGRTPTRKDAIDEGQPERAPQCSRGHTFRGRNNDTTGWDTDGGYALKQEWL